MTTHRPPDAYALLFELSQYPNLAKAQEMVHNRFGSRSAKIVVRCTPTDVDRKFLERWGFNEAKDESRELTFERLVRTPI